MPRRSSNLKQTTSYAKRIQPLPGYVLVEPLEDVRKTAAGIYIPDTASQEKPQEGKVLAIGPSKKTEEGLEEAHFAVGDRVIYKKWGGENLKYDEKELQLVEFKDVMAIVKE